jgi:hypothetical protein
MVTVKCTADIINEELVKMWESGFMTYVDRRSNVIGAALFWEFIPDLQRLFGVPQRLRLEWLMR